ncbi:hypothetical protein GCM10022276_20820 [Sphingomonas limnosediminicola]|uniref:Lipoprotein n=1 Tax=Sphingomonas limnosediminicola TaxID=940133 RepID=A0ABP7LIU1_9SPHN
MRNPIVIAVLVTAAGCNNARAASPDSSNPAHCIAAMNFEAYWLSKNPKHADSLAEVRARSLFEAQKIKASGASLKAAAAEGAALTKAYANDADKMNALALACLRAEDSDARFQQEKQTLIETVRNNWRE